MENLKKARPSQFISELLRDENLTKKATLNAVSSVLEYAAKLIVVFVVQPWLVKGLGDYFFGTWQILLRFIGYISPASGRPTQALRWVIANEQNSSEIQQKKRYVGSTITVWLLFLPVLILLGSLLAWFIPDWIKTPVEYIWIVRITTIVLVVNLIMTNLATVPQSVLQGENLGYKRMGASTLLVLIGGGLTWLAIYLHTGIIGVAAAALLTTIITGLFFLQVVRNYASWFGAIRSSLDETLSFLRLSGWFMLWNLISNLMMASDVVILGLLNSVESVTIYSLTKYAPETLIGIMSIITFGVAPGLGGIIGTGDIQKASRLRGEIMTITWIMIVSLGTTLVIWNRAFLSLWVGLNYYSGGLSNLLIILVVIQFVIIRNDSSFIDLTLKLQEKVILGAISVSVSLAVAAVLVGYFNLGIVGVSLGLLLGRSILSFGYPSIVGRHLKINWTLQVKSMIKPALFTAIILFIAVEMGEHLPGFWETGIEGWIVLLLICGETFLLSFAAAFYLGLTKDQRQRILARVKMILPFLAKYGL